MAHILGHYNTSLLYTATLTPLSWNLSPQKVPRLHGRSHGS